MANVTSATYSNGNGQGGKVSPGENSYTLGGSFSGSESAGDISLSPSQGSVDSSKTTIRSQSTSSIGGKFHFAKGTSDSDLGDENGTMGSSVDGSNIYPVEVSFGS